VAYHGVRPANAVQQEKDHEHIVKERAVQKKRQTSVVEIETNRKVMFYEATLRRRASWTSDKARAVSIVADPPGRMASRCFVVLRDCWTVGITRGMKSEMSLSYVNRVVIEL